MNPWTILCDFDGTIAVADVFDTLLERFGEAGWRQVESDWEAGRIGSRQCMTRQVALLHLDQAQLDAHLDSVRLDPAFAAFLDLARQLQTPVQIVSDGLDYAINYLLQRAGLHDVAVAANRLQPATEANRWRLETPFAQPGCNSGMCKCQQAQDAANENRHVLLIGDGASDFCVSNRVDFVFAKDRLVDHCRSMDLPHIAIAGFADAMQQLPRLLDGTLVARETPRELPV